MSKLQMNHNNEGEIFFTGRHPDKRTNAQWVRIMNRRFGFDWPVVETKRKTKRKKRK